MTKEPVSQTAETRIFDEDLHHKALVCNCRKTTHKGKERLCPVCERAWQQAWDLSEGKIIRKSGASPESASEAQPVEQPECVNCAGKIEKRYRGSELVWIHISNNHYFCDGGHADPKVEAQREEEPKPRPDQIREQSGIVRRLDSRFYCTINGKLYVRWEYAGGPDQCKHGYARCFTCPECEKSSTPTPSDMPEPLVSEQSFEEWWLAYDEIEQELPSRYESAKAAWDAAKGKYGA